MPMKTAVEPDNLHKAENQELKRLQEQLKVSHDENNLLKEFNNLKDESYYRFQIVSSMQQLAGTLQGILTELQNLRTDLLSSLDEETDNGPVEESE